MGWGEESWGCDRRSQAPTSQCQRGQGHLGAEGYVIEGEQQAEWPRGVCVYIGREGGLGLRGRTLVAESSC